MLNSFAGFAIGGDSERLLNVCTKSLFKGVFSLLVVSGFLKFLTNFRNDFGLNDTM